MAETAPLLQRCGFRPAGLAVTYPIRMPLRMLAFTTPRVAPKSNGKNQTCSKLMPFVRGDGPLAGAGAAGQAAAQQRAAACPPPG